MCFSYQDNFILWKLVLSLVYLTHFHDCRLITWFLCYVITINNKGLTMVLHHRDWHEPYVYMFLVRCSVRCCLKCKLTRWYKLESPLTCFIWIDRICRNCSNALKCESLQAWLYEFIFNILYRCIWEEGKNEDNMKKIMVMKWTLAGGYWLQPLRRDELREGKNSCPDSYHQLIKSISNDYNLVPSPYVHGQIWYIRLAKSTRYNDSWITSESFLN